MSIRLSNKDLLKLIRKLKKEDCETLEELETKIVKQKIAYIDTDNEYDLFDISPKNNLFMKKLVFFVKDEPLFPYSKIVRMKFSNKNKRITFYTDDNETFTKHKDNVIFDLKNLDGKEFFDFLN